MQILHRTTQYCSVRFHFACVIFLGSTVLADSSEKTSQPIADSLPGVAVDQSPPPDLPLPRIQLDEPKAPLGVMEKIDGVFGKAVELMDMIFFFRIGKTKRNYVQYNHLEYYQRDRDSDAPFKKYNLNNPRGDFEDLSLTAAEANGLAARDKLVIGSDAQGKPRSFRHGLIDGRPVEYVTVVIDTSSKYVEIAGADGSLKYRKQLAKRGLISPHDKDILSMAEIDRLADLGWLKTEENKNKIISHILEEDHGGAPVVVLWLALGSVFFTLYMRGVNIWGFRHAIEIVRGKYDNPNEPGEVTHFQALSSALSATVGLGNIAGVTIAMTLGGPGAFFWMLACGFFGMTSKFVECTLGQKYREVKPDGTILGGPMQYLHVGLKELGLGQFGFVLSIVFAIMCIMASFGGGNMFQANQSGAAMLNMVQHSNQEKVEQFNKDIVSAAKEKDFDLLAKLQSDKSTLQGEMAQFKKTFLPVFGILFAAAVGMVILGGIKRIAAAAEKIVPTMCLIYVAACLWIIFSHIADVPELIAEIFRQAFTGKALGGGFVGALIIGVQRAAFSNEAGVGSAAIAHSAAKTEEPVREGAVALLGPFIDTIVVCSMTALVILITDAWNKDQWVVEQGLAGAALTMKAFGNEIKWFPIVLSIAILLFAYSTIISWSYYGERCWVRLFGTRSTIVYRIIYVMAVIVGSIVHLGAVLDFSDFMILSMAFPNILGLILLSPKVRRDLLDYWRRYKAGEFKTFK